MWPLIGRGELNPIQQNWTFQARLIIIAAIATYDVTYYFILGIYQYNVTIRLGSENDIQDVSKMKL